MARNAKPTKTMTAPAAAASASTDKGPSGPSEASAPRSGHIDPALKAANIRQLRRSRGQVDGIERMLNDDRYCADIIVQITAARASLQAVARSLLEAHLKVCHKAAMNNGGAVADKMYQELVDLVAKMSK